jgi:hypothetical protein
MIEIDKRESSTPELQILMTGLAIAESPRWHEDRLWFSNWGDKFRDKIIFSSVTLWSVISSFFHI